MAACPLDHRRVDVASDDPTARAEHGRREPDHDASPTCDVQKDLAGTEPKVL